MSQAASLQDPRADRVPANRTPGRRRNGWIPSPRSLDASLAFLKAFARAPLSVGAIWPSSRALARRVADCCHVRPGATLVELGPGTGAFTSLLLNALNGRGQFLAVEINPANVTLLRRRFPQCEVIHGSAANLPTYLDARRADCIVSGLPWGNMLPQTQRLLLRAVLSSLKPGGQFIAFAYLHAAWLPTSLLFRRRLHRHFQMVETTSVIWRNLPPAFVFRCWRT